MKAIASSYVFPMILKSSPKDFTLFLLKAVSTVSSSHIFLSPHHDVQTPGCIFCVMNNSDWIFQKYVKFKAMDPKTSVQGSLCLHLHPVSLSQSVLGKAMLLDLLFLNQIPSETFFFCLKTPVGELCKWQPYDQSIIKTEGQFPVPLLALSEEENLVSKFPVVPFVSWSGQSQGYLWILKCELVEFLLFMKLNVG